MVGSSWGGRFQSGGGLRLYDDEMLLIGRAISGRIYGCHGGRPLGDATAADDFPYIHRGKMSTAKRSRYAVAAAAAAVAAGFRRALLFSISRRCQIERVDNPTRWDDNALKSTLTRPLIR